MQPVAKDAWVPESETARVWPPISGPVPPSELSPRLVRIVDLRGFPDAADPIARELVRCNRNLWVEIADGMSGLGKSESCYIRNVGADLICVFATKTIQADIQDIASSKGWVCRRIDNYNLFLTPDPTTSKKPRNIKLSVPRIASVHVWVPDSPILNLDTLPVKMEPHPSLMNAWMACLDVDLHSKEP